MSARALRASLLGATLLAVQGASARAAPLEVSVGRGSLVSIGIGGGPTSPAGPPAADVSVLGSSPSGEPQLVGAKVGETELSVPVPAVPKAELPSLPPTPVPTPTTPAPPAVPPLRPPATGGLGGSNSSPAGATATTAGVATPASGVASSASSSGGPAGPARRRAPGAGPSGRGHRETGTATTPSPPAGGTLTPTARAPAARQGLAGASRSSRNPLDSIGRSLPLPLPVPDWSKPIILALLLLALALGVRSRLATRRARRLDGQRQVLQRDLDTMQAALVPEIPEVVGGIGVSVAYRPAEGPGAGGDFYDLFMPAPDRVAAILGDVAGHGHGALQQAALTRFTLRAYMQAGMAPRAALALTANALSEPGAEQLATVAIVLYDMRRGTLTYALAGHPPPILLGAEVAEAPAACSSPPLGCDLPTGRRQRTISFPLGAQVCLFSDGLIEARCAPVEDEAEPNLLGRDRLRELLDELPPGPAAKQLLAAIRAEAQATPDDMAACILTAMTPCQTPILDMEELEVDLHALQGGHLGSYLEECGLDLGEIQQLLACAETEVGGQGAAVLLVDRSGPEPQARIVGQRAVGPATNGGERRVTGVADYARPAGAGPGPAPDPLRPRRAAFTES